MSVYVDNLPNSCYDCFCNNDDWKCRLTYSDLPDKWGVRNGDCPLKVLVHCKDCAHYIPKENKCGFTGRFFIFKDDYCSNADKKEK